MLCTRERNTTYLPSFVHRTLLIRGAVRPLERRMFAVSHSSVVTVMRTGTNMTDPWDRKWSTDIDLCCQSRQRSQQRLSHTFNSSWSRLFILVWSLRIFSEQQACLSTSFPIFKCKNINLLGEAMEAAAACLKNYGACSEYMKILVYGTAIQVRTFVFALPQRSSPRNRSHGGFLNSSSA